MQSETVKTNAKKHVLYLLAEIACLAAIFVSALHFFPAGQTAANSQSAGQTESPNMISLPLTDFSAKDFQVDGSVLTALSDDPWLLVTLEQPNNITAFSISIKEMSVEYTHCRIFYDEGEIISGDFYIDQDLTAGENFIVLPQPCTIQTVRIDLTDQASTVINVAKIGLIK